MLLVHYQRKFWKEAGKGEDSPREPQSRGRGVSVTAPSSLQHCPRHPEGPSTHRHAGLEPAPLGAGPPSQDDTGQGHRLPLQHPDGGGAAGNLWGHCRERRRRRYTGFPWEPGPSLPSAPPQGHADTFRLLCSPPQGHAGQLQAWGTHLLASYLFALLYSS